MFSMNSCFCTCRNWTSVEQFSSGFQTTSREDPKRLFYMDMYLKNFPALRECPRAVYWGRFSYHHLLTTRLALFEDVLEKCLQRCFNSTDYHLHGARQQRAQNELWKNIGDVDLPTIERSLKGSRWRIIPCKHNLWRKKDTFGEQHTIAGSNCWLQSILEGPCQPSLSESESKDWGSQAILPPTNTHCKASVLSLGDAARSRICSFRNRTKHGSFTNKSSPSNLAKGGSVCSRKWLSGQCGTPCKTVQDSFVRTSLGPASGRDRVPLQPWLCSLSSERQVKTE